MVDELDPKKFHVMSKKTKLALIIGLLVFVSGVLPPLGYLYYNFALSRPSQTDKEITFEIKKGQSVSEIADNLYEAGAINSKFLFNFYAVSSGLDRNIQAGLYTIYAGTSIRNLVGQFQHGTLDSTITFLEGWRVEEFARKAAAEFPTVSYEDFLKEALPYEGYLFPDTYIFTNNVTSAEIVAHLREVFDNKTKDLLTTAYLKKSGLTAKEAVTIASIIEREAKTDDDRRVVAGILIKRWKEGMKLDADATTQYAIMPLRFGCGGVVTPTCPAKEQSATINWWPNDLTVAELAYDSPYNTRKNLGLPPEPISSYSLSALKAVLTYTTTDYYYYLHGTDGNTYFAKTLEEHQDNAKKYLSN